MVSKKATAETVMALWCEVLEVPDATADDHFFEVGGDSFAALRLVERFKTDFGVELELAEFFEDPTLRGVSAQAGV